MLYFFLNTSVCPCTWGSGIQFCFHESMTKVSQTFLNSLVYYQHYIFPKFPLNYLCSHLADGLGFHHRWERCSWSCWCHLLGRYFLCEHRKTFSADLLLAKLLSAGFGLTCHRLSYRPAATSWINILWDHWVGISSMCRQRQSSAASTCVGPSVDVSAENPTGTCTFTSARLHTA